MIVYLPQITNGQTLISNEEIYTHTHTKNTTKNLKFETSN